MKLINNAESHIEVYSLIFVKKNYSDQLKKAENILKAAFDDIFDTPSLKGEGWTGFTRDYHQLEGVFSENGGIYEINPTEYIKDLMHYKEKAFDFDEIKDVFNLIVSLLEKAIKKGVNVKAKRV